MGDFQTNKDGIVAGIHNILERRFGIPLESDGSLGAPFKRLFPQIKGDANSTGGRSYIAINTTLNQALGSGFPIGSNEAVRIACGQRCYTLCLDPDYTAANAVIYVHFGYPADYISMRPGDAIDVPAGFTEFYCWSGSSQIALKITGGILAMYGGVGFLAGSTLGARPTFQRDRAGRGLASLICLSSVSATAPNETTGAIAAGTKAFSSCGLKGMRVSFFCADVSDNYVAAPATLAATIRPWVLHHVDMTGTLGALHTSDTVDSLSNVCWVPNKENDLTVSQFSRTFDREVVAGGLAVTFQQVSLAGTGVDHLWVLVEGY